MGIWNGPPKALRRLHSTGRAGAEKKCEKKRLAELGRTVESWGELKRIGGAGESWISRYLDFWMPVDFDSYISLVRDVRKITEL